MNIKKYSSNQKTLLVCNLILGITLLLMGSLLKVNLSFISNKALTALSFIPFSIAFTCFINLSITKKNPKKMKNIIINESDERLVLRKITAEAKAYRVLRFMLYILFLGYTFSNPNDIFEAPMWWILCTLAFAPLLLTIVFEIMYDYNEHK